MKVYSLLMIDDSPINLTEKEYSVIDMLQSLGLPRTEATAIVCLKDCRELRSLHIELVSGLKQPEVSVAMRPLKERGWVEEKTEKNRMMTLNIALNYGGRSEIIDAIQSFNRDVQRGMISFKDLDERQFSEYLYTRGLPDPDLMIRTSGEERISNFLLWQLAYTELYFSKTLWPDFRKRDLLIAILDFQRRERRFGKITSVLPQESAPYER